LYIDIKWHGRRHSIFCDRHRQSFFGWEHAAQVLQGIRIEITEQRFHPDRYKVRTPSALALRTYIESWLAERDGDVTAGTLKPSTRRLYGSYARCHLFPALGGHDIRELRGLDIRALQRILRDKGLAAKTIFNIVRLLHGILKDAWRDGDIDKVPPFPRIEMAEPSYRTLTHAQQLAVLAQVEPKYQGFFRLLVALPLRPGEARALQWRDLAWATGELTIRRTWSDNTLVNRRKRGANYSIGLPTALLDVLRGEYRRAVESWGTEPHPTAFIFSHPASSRWAGRAFSKGIPRVWRRACTKAGVPYIGLYSSTKHSFGRHALEAGADLGAIQGIMGHADRRSTERYAKPSARVHRRTAELVELHRLDCGKSVARAAPADANH